MKILIANDHGALELKKSIMNSLEKDGHELNNLGVDTADSVDYPDIAKKAARRFLEGGYDFGILCCGTGIGIGIAANKVPGIRCAQVFDKYTAEMAKRHNNANFLSFGGRVNYNTPVMDIIKTFMEASFEAGRHADRLAKIEASN